MKILVVSANRLTVDDKYPVRDSKNLQVPIQMQYVKNESVFLNILFHWWELHQLVNIFKSKMIVKANVLPILQTVKYLVRPLSKKRRLRTSFDSENAKGSHTLVKSPWGHFYHIFSSLLGELIWKVSSLVESEVLGVIVNTLTADDKYSVQDFENFQFLIQMKLC